MERDVQIGASNPTGYHFNSHAHVERDDKTEDTGSGFNDFNSHAHVERDLVTLGLALQTMHFNSHAHVERDKYNKNCIDEINISTHTLTWSVTLLV